MQGANTSEPLRWGFVFWLFVGTGLLTLLAQREPRSVASSQPYTIQNVTLEGCHDGDTCRFVGVERPVRLARVDAAELDGPCPRLAYAQRGLLLQLLQASRETTLEIRNVDPYNRYVAEIWVWPSATQSQELERFLHGELLNVSTYLIQSGQVQRYQPGYVDSCLPWNPPSL